jgi:stearoyl-CoA desaturase (Delta-9 desaturase)
MALRIHHKFTDTNADPHNSHRGFFFSHMGWLCCNRHPDIKKFGAKVYVGDLENDSDVMFQHKNYLLLILVFSVIVPTLIPWWFWSEKLVVAFSACVALRLVAVYHNTWCINSVAHFFGMKPYDE